MIIFNSSVQGSSHIEVGKECQDYSLTWHDPTTGSGQAPRSAVAVVSDGHGGECHYNSARGSKYACEVTVECIRELMDCHLSYHKMDASVFNRLFSAICTRWIDKIEQEEGDDPISSYGCTLLAYIQVPGYWFAFQIGDGKICVKDNGGNWSQPVPWDDERCFSNITTSLCDVNPLSEFRYHIGKRHPKAVFLGSDGIDDTFGDGDLLHGFYQHILDSIPIDGAKAVVEQLPQLLRHFSDIGSKDDMSVAAVIN